MKPDNELCLCFHVTKRKVINFLKVEKPSRASQLSQCGGAGTGCGWCRPFLEKLFQQHQIQQAQIQQDQREGAEPSGVSANIQPSSDGRFNSDEESDIELSAEQYASLRASYIQQNKGRQEEK